MKEEKIDKLIERAIHRVGREKDEHDFATLQEFLKEEKIKVSASDRNQNNSSKIKRLWLSVASIAAIITIVFSLNIYQQNTRMNEAFYTHYSPLEYDPQLMSRGEDSFIVSITFFAFPLSCAFK